MNWRVGVLRAGVENTAWTASGEATDWCSARRGAIDALYDLAERELVQHGRRRQEYRLQVDDVTVVAWPGLDPDQVDRLDLSGVDEVLPHDRAAAPTT